jgi:hypothetical protein
MADPQTDAKLIGSRQFGNGGTKTLPSRSTLAMPSFADRVMPQPQWPIMLSQDTTWRDRARRLFPKMAGRKPGHSAQNPSMSEMGSYANDTHGSLLPVSTKHLRPVLFARNGPVGQGNTNGIPILAFVNQLTVV